MRAITGEALRQCRRKKGKRFVLLKGVLAKRFAPERVEKTWGKRFDLGKGRFQNEALPSAERLF